MADNLFKLGMTSDAALRAIEKNRIGILRPALSLGKTEHGKIVAWFIAGHTLRFERTQPAPAPYVLVKIDSAPGHLQKEPKPMPDKKKTKRGSRGKKSDDQTN
jgi:hypothetical protein